MGLIRRTSSNDHERDRTQSPGTNRTSFFKLLLARWVNWVLASSSLVGELLVLLAKLELAWLVIEDGIHRNVSNLLLRLLGSCVGETLTMLQSVFVQEVRERMRWGVLGRGYMWCLGCKRVRVGQLIKTRQDSHACYAFFVYPPHAIISWREKRGRHSRRPCLTNNRALNRRLRSLRLPSRAKRLKRPRSRRGRRL